MIATIMMMMMMMMMIVGTIFRIERSGTILVRRASVYTEFVWYYLTQLFFLNEV